MVYLVILDLFWSAAAFVWDWPKMAQINFLVWPFAIICPIYPLLLAFVWFQLYRKKRPNQLLLSFATIPSIIFGILAIAYYPTAMFYQGFSWNGFGQIFWVLFYALQGWYLLKRHRISTLAVIAVSCFLFLKLALDYYYLSWGYLDFSKLPSFIILALFVVGQIATFTLLILRLRENSLES